MKPLPSGRGDFLEMAALSLLALQFGVFAKMWADLGFDRATDGYPILIMSTALFIGGHRKLLRNPPNRGAARGVVAARAVLLLVLAFGTVLVGIRRLMPDAQPAPELVAQAMFALLFGVIALKGTSVGKLKPGSAMGLCVPWTKQSRLAWDRAHRTLGRVLFWGGLVGLIVTFVVPLLVAGMMWLGTVALAVSAALIEGWRSWRLDPDRGRPA